MNKHYIIEVLSKGKRHWWRIRRRGNWQVILTSEVYSAHRKALAAAMQFADAGGRKALIDVKVIER